MDSNIIELDPDDFPVEELDPRLKMFGFSVDDDNVVEIYNPQTRSSMTVNADELPFLIAALSSYHQSISSQ